MTLIEALVEVHVTQLAIANTHNLAVSGDGKAYSWGGSDSNGEPTPAYSTTDVRTYNLHLIRIFTYSHGRGASDGAW